MTNKYICIHGHFYQPPRENPWLDEVEQEDSATPFHDWNEKINFECYATNAAARILDDNRRIVKIVNNYAKMSYNFGPTLLSWLQKADPTTYQLIIEADKESQKQFSGHGSAMAQVYNHAIMPLANARDKQTQVIWGIEDFKYRFGRKPEGMWLAETAANIATLEILAEQGIIFTVLAPRQAKNIRKLGTENWQEVNESIDTRRAYLCKLPSGKTINLFFYNGNIAQAVAFEGLLNEGKALAKRLLGGFSGNEEAELVNIATDGESYGHHHRYGEMALASCLNEIQDRSPAKLTNYGEYLEKFPAQYEVQIHENSSWSCVHGVERWKANCGCNTGGSNGWHQRWRSPLRNALNWLRDELIYLYKEQSEQYVKDVWAVRDAYIEVLLDRNAESIDAFIEKQAFRVMTKREKVHLFRLLEMQRNAMLMFTSCGWFFDEVSGIETNQCLKYACRALHYAEQVSEDSLRLEEEFVYRLGYAPSNLKEYGTAAGSYEKNVRPAHVSLLGVGMHYAASSLFEKYPEKLEFFNYIAKSETFNRITAGNHILATGRTTVQSKITHSEKHFSFVVLYFGGLNIIGNISLNMERTEFDNLQASIKKAFREEANLGNVLALMQRFEGEKFTIWQLFKEEKQKIINQITQKTLSGVESSFRKIYENNYQLVNGLQSAGVAIPDAYKSAMQFVLNQDLTHFFEKAELDIKDLKRILSEFQKWGISITNEQNFQLAVSERIFKEVQRLTTAEGSSQEDLKNLVDTFAIVAQMRSVRPNIWKSQNLYFAVLKAYEGGKKTYPSADWKKLFYELGDLFAVKV